MTAGSAATALAIPTGFLAAVRMGYPLSYGTPVFGHLAATTSAASLMLGLVLWRVRGLRSGREPGLWAYVGTLLAAGGVLALAAHWGGVLVYGS